MTTDFRLASFIAAHPACVLVEIAQAKGSTPREAGTFMLVAEKAIWGTIGGGQFEYMAIDNARAMLGGGGESVMDIPLGPEIGQCCGGRTRLAFTPMSQALADALEARMRGKLEQRPSVFIFGAGHVGQALASALAPLPFAVTVVETRPEALEDLPAGTETHLTAMPETLVKKIPAGGAAIILTHDHALDFLIAKEALSRPDLAYVGMIGSLTKRATFSHWLKREGGNEAMLSHLILPIGGNAVKDKRPAVIAAMVAAELLETHAALEETASKRQVPSV
ncbi:molybdenum cofactor sulfurylase [Neorhizobium sp. R1-B]|uniref:xanthine dehydrogenase accessory protein XdhC n=1 Tax=unclassified Neorhizobium TaxID=2629175 RepID=UPI001046E093|nr:MULTISPECIES: xanthine dehydrogenase accessory protein XdhC [unclassified Neorhizobium]TCV74490.1 molybdenum cofactor sulfurylase [Neorhizobium sp. S3-V5DH]TDX87676.1 molybdenum cofactor sulfurylase [Neorhizobium sp. R1-B]